MRTLCFFAILLFGLNAIADDAVPFCWSSDQTGIQDGLFRVHVQTAGNSAQDVAAVMAILSQSLAGQTGVAASPRLDQIEIDVYGELKYWRPTATYPTLESFKAAIVKSIAPVLNQNGVSVECAKTNHRS